MFLNQHKSLMVWLSTILTSQQQSKVNHLVPCQNGHKDQGNQNPPAGMWQQMETGNSLLLQDRQKVVACVNLTHSLLQLQFAGLCAVFADALTEPLGHRSVGKKWAQYVQEYKGNNFQWMQTQELLVTAMLSALRNKLLSSVYIGIGA